jgi:hypothetical protein
MLGGGFLMRVLRKRWKGKSGISWGVVSKCGDSLVVISMKRGAIGQIMAIIKKIYIYLMLILFLETSEDTISSENRGQGRCQSDFLWME